MPENGTLRVNEVRHPFGVVARRHGIDVHLVKLRYLGQELFETGPGLDVVVFVVAWQTEECDIFQRLVVRI